MVRLDQSRGKVPRLSEVDVELMQPSNRQRRFLALSAPGFGVIPILIDTTPDSSNFALVCWNIAGTASIPDSVIPAPIAPRRPK
jgi:hypothetical protein